MRERFQPRVCRGRGRGVYDQRWSGSDRRQQRNQEMEFALRAQTGVSIWEYECARGSNHEFAVAGAEVFMISGGLEVIDASSGTRRWSLPYGPRQEYLSGSMNAREVPTTSLPWPGPRCL